ncbi:MAG: hypothetical protein OFPI_44960 [Osedax symbiont Rs2]|nr:MAG: hypothetical protein OFPI_44960 [Osedax symbiont Rs2]EPJ45019.1 MAG: hypothetical protein OFPII_30520 [Osedax symbiont Rs1]
MGNQGIISCYTLQSRIESLQKLNTEKLNIVVIGAGASGLAFALECIQLGVEVRIIDKRVSRSTTGKATGVALGTWNQLKKFGISSENIAAAIPMRNFVFHDDGKLVANIFVPSLNDHPPAHLYPQSLLEQQMEKALNIRGVLVEYGTGISHFESIDKIVRVTLQKGATIHSEKIEVDWLIGADGAHSTVRNIAKLPFIGRDYPEKWSVAEIKTDLWPNDVQAQLFLQSNGVGLFLSQPTKGIVQGILNSPEVVDKLKDKFPDASILYSREFSVSLRRVSTPRVGRVWLIGDAAHVQSPVGGQGLNLAIWDGITLAESLLADKFDVEQRLIKKAKKVLLFTDFDYRMLASRSVILRSSRNWFWSVAAKYPIIAKWFFKLISGV